MKTKIVTLIIVAAIAMSSCKKEELAKPSSDLRVEKVANKNSAGAWD